MSNSDYPAGAADDPKAPFNQQDCHECNGTGDCFWCDGTGVSDVEDCECLHCSGTKVCDSCCGTGNQT
tara:strand:+ start:1052 stop:1255 length:204 start_codon:yes stop_codon:yes gene_type:complete